IPCPAAADPRSSNPGMVFSLATTAQKDCVVQAMQARGLPEVAVTFLQRYEVFLASFEEHGRVDLGSIDAAWQNMGRPEPVFLNSTPSMLPLSLLMNGSGPNGPTRQWLAQPAYVAALHDDASVLSWPEY